MTVEETAAQVAALERELSGYVARGMDERAEGVRVELARLKGESPVSRPARAQSVDRLAGKSKTTRGKKEA